MVLIQLYPVESSPSVTDMDSVFDFLAFLPLKHNTTL